MPFDNAPDDTFELEGLVSWLETQPPETVYDFIDLSDSSRNCLIGRYFTVRGLSVISVGGVTWDSEQEENNLIPRYFNEVAMNVPRTYGAALDRARALIDA